MFAKAAAMGKLSWAPAHHSFQKTSVGSTRFAPLALQEAQRLFQRATLKTASRALCSQTKHLEMQMMTLFGKGRLIFQHVDSDPASTKAATITLRGKPEMYGRQIFFKTRFHKVEKRLTLRFLGCFLRILEFKRHQNILHPPTLFYKGTNTRTCPESHNS